MALLELARLALFIVEWVLSAACLAIFPTTLYRVTTGTDPNTRVYVCAIGSTGFCLFGIVWTSLAFVIITICILWHLSEYCSKYALPAPLEVIIVAALAIWWMALAITASLMTLNVTIIDVTESARRFIRGGSWVLAACFIFSTVIAWCIARDEEQDRQDAYSCPVQPNQPEDFPEYE